MRGYPFGIAVEHLGALLATIQFKGIKVFEENVKIVERRMEIMRRLAKAGGEKANFILWNRTDRVIAFEKEKRWPR